MGSMIRLIPLTLWPSMYDTVTPTPVRESWETLVERMRSHTTLRKKEDAGGFGPYRLRPGATSRTDASVAEMTLLVFDADAAQTMDEIHECVARIEAAGVAQHWSSTYRYDPSGYLGFRLLMPISRPVTPEEWPTFRRAVLREFTIPAKVEQCSGKSHYYHLPSCPPGAAPMTITRLGSPLGVTALHLAAQPPPSRPAPDLGAYEPPEEPTTPVDVKPLLDAVRSRRDSLRRTTTDREAARKAATLTRVLAGEPLAGPGERNNAATSATALLVYALPPTTPLSVLVHIIRPSIEAMIAEGSDLTFDNVERLFLSSMAKRWQQSEVERQVLERLTRDLENVRAKIPVYDPRR